MSRRPPPRGLFALWLVACGCPDAPEAATATPTESVAAKATAHVDAVDPLFAPEAFTRLPAAPRSGSWRARIVEEPQSLEAFLARSQAVRDDEREVLYLQPLADYPQRSILPGELPALPLVEDGFVTFVFAPAPEDLAEFISVFYQQPTKVGAELELEALAPAPARVRRHHGQFNAHQILEALEARIPADAHSVTALMARDLYASDEQEYAFGHAIAEDRVAVASFAQLDPQFIGQVRKDGFRRLIRERGYKLVAHEIGHTLGMEHCDEYRCVMNGVAHVGELDETPLHLGPHCLRKLMRHVDHDPVRRYEALAAIYERLGLLDEARWAQQRSSQLQTPS